MLVLLSFVLVLVATVLLVLGLLVTDGLTLIYLSIGMSALAAILLVVAVRISKPSSSGPAAPAPLDPDPEAKRETDAELDESRSLEATGASDTDDSTSAEWLASDKEWDAAGDDGASEDGVEFPIADYDELTVDEVLPLLPQLYSEELDVVAERERSGRSRPEVLDRLAELRETGTEADRLAEEEEAVSVAAAYGAAATAIDGADARDGSIPISGYDTMAVSAIISALGGLSDTQLDDVRAHEVSTKNRRTVLAAIDRRTGAGDPAATPVAATVAAAPDTGATVKKAAAKKPAPKKATAASAKKAVPAPAKKAPAHAKKAAAPPAPAPAKKATAATAKKAAPAPAPASAKKAAHAKKSAAPAKGADEND